MSEKKRKLTSWFPSIAAKKRKKAKEDTKEQSKKAEIVSTAIVHIMHCSAET